MPYFKPVISPSHPIIKGTIAPPAIAVIKMPDKEPWCSFTEFNARDNMMGHMTEAKKPIKGKVYKAMSLLPKIESERQIIAAAVKPVSTFRLSIIFTINNPKKVPAVINPQNHDTARAPVV